MFLRIETFPGKKLIGQRKTMSFADDTTADLFRGFMPRKKEILNAVNTDVFCLQNYPIDWEFDVFKPNKRFEKLAAVEVFDFDSVPTNMEAFTVAQGLYAVFLHQGSAHDAAKTFYYIFKTWIPNSDYSIDARLHFQILGAKYKNDDPSSEEEVWIPVRLK